MQEEEGFPASQNQLTVRMPLLSSASGNGFDQITAERESGCGAQTANRWPRQETMALLKIRSDMDRAFQEATLKAPLWEEVSRKLSEEGYQRNAKKCKEKFENVFKYYKRTKEARSGKSYRFFTQLESLLSSPTTTAGELPPPPATMANVEPAVTVANPITTLPPTEPRSSSSNTSSFSPTEWDKEDEEGESSGKRKRKNRGSESGKMRAFFEELIQKLMDQQEKMLQRFLEAIERREQNRMIREEAWRRQEKTRLSRERELAAQERAAAASRQAAIISFVEKLTGQKIPFPPIEETPLSLLSSSPQVEINEQSIKETALVVSKTEQVLSSRWPKAEVLALIKLRSGMEMRYQESVPKGPLWEEISAGMLSLGYNRSAKRCKEKWENINKYFKKVKEGNKSRPEDAKTCPYFHQLEALYRNKLIGGSSSNDDQLALISAGGVDQGSGSVSGVKKPEDIVKKKIEEVQAVESESSFQFRMRYVMPLVLCGTMTLQNNFEFSTSMVR